MLTIRLPKAEWGKAWRVMIEVAPVRLITDDPLYEVLPAHLEVLAARGFTYELTPFTASRTAGRRRRPARGRCSPARSNECRWPRGGSALPGGPFAAP